MLAFGGICTLILSGIALQALRPILVPFATAVLLSIVLRPVVTVLARRARRRSYARALGVTAAMLVALSVAFLMGMLFYVSANSLVEVLPRYGARIEEHLLSLGAFVDQLALRAGMDGAAREALRDVTVSGAASKMGMNLVSTGFGSLLSLTSGLVITAVFLLFLLSTSGHMGPKLSSALPPPKARLTLAVLMHVERHVRSYLVTKTLTSAVTGYITWVILAAVGVDMALLWGTLAFALNFIPSAGSIVAVLIPFVFSLLQFDALTRPLLVLILPGFVQFTIGSVIEPRLMAGRMGLSAVYVITSLAFWGWLWGAWGMILAIPIAATLKTLCEGVDTLRPLATLMGGPVRRPAGARPAPTTAPAPDPVVHTVAEEAPAVAGEAPAAERQARADDRTAAGRQHPDVLHHEDDVPATA